MSFLLLTVDPSRARFAMLFTLWVKRTEVEGKKSIGHAAAIDPNEEEA